MAHHLFYKLQNMRQLFNYRKYIWLLSWFIVPFFTFAQTKSTNIQTIGGKKYYIHKLEKGQSLYSLARLYNVELNAIYSENPQAEKGAKAGEEIKIPVSPQAAPVTTVSPVSAAGIVDTVRYITYKVSKGETLYAITKKLNVSDKELEKWNPGISQGIKEGQLIILGEKRKVGNAVTTVYTTTAGTDPSNTNPDSLNPHVTHAKKQSYNVGLILPFRIDQTLATDINYLAGKKLSFPALSTLSIDFYMGFKRAADSLSGKDMEVNLSLFDVDDKDSGRIEQIVSSETFKQLDLIVGPLYAGGFKVAAQKAKQMNVPIVSPFTQQNKILYNNNWTSKMTPSQYTLLEGLADYCLDSLKQANGYVMIVNGGKDPKEAAFIKAFKAYYNERMKDRKSAADTVTEVKGFAGVKAAYKAGVKNIVITFSANQVFIMDFITQLAVFSGKKDVVLCGWQSISALENLDQDYLNQLQFTFPAQNNITNLMAYDNLAKEYKEQMNIAPGEYFYEGFDLGYYYLRALKESGIDAALTLDKREVELPYTRFKFYRPDNTTGFDNKGMYIFRYKDYKLERTGWK